ncbi:MAG: helix-turn-helix transcriptional regulator [Bacteroidales bacterium]|nr:helix-turn-helix transcriptional regulator [Bacteroidales bacterium]
MEYKKSIIENIQTNSLSNLPEDFDNKMIKRIFEFVNYNISNELLNTNMVADQIGMSRTQLWRLFKTKTGKSLKDYIKDIKMQKAATMLMTGKYRISEVSDYVGFSDPRYFSRIFIKEYGITPTEYAEKFRKN